MKKYFKAKYINRLNLYKENPTSNLVAYFNYLRVFVIIFYFTPQILVAFIFLSSKSVFH